MRVVSHVQGDRAGEWGQSLFKVMERGEWCQSLFKVMERGEGRQSCSR